MESDGIPLFMLEKGSRGKVFPMFGHMGADYGSILMKLNTDDDRIYSLQVKCYPRLLHFLKSHGLTMEMATTLPGIQKKFKKIGEVANPIA